MKATTKKGIGIAVNILSYTFFAMLLLVLVFVVVVRVQGKTPGLFGYRIYTVVSPSMEPDLKVGDVILSKEVASDQLKKGDIVTYKGESGDFAGKLITHQIQRVWEENGKLYIVTKGTANDTEDPKIEAVKVEAVMTSKLDGISAFYRFAGTGFGFVVMIVVPLGLIIIFEVVSITKKRKKAKNDQTDDINTEDAAKGD